MPAIMVDPTDLQIKPLPSVLMLLDGRTAQGDLDQTMGVMAGWLIPQPVPPVADGFQRTFGNPPWSNAGDGTAAPVYTDVSLAYIQATQTALQAQQESDDAARPFEISKVAVTRALRAMGKLPDFDAMLASDPNALRDWQDSVVIDSDNAQVVAMLPYMSQIIGGDALEFLRTCKSAIS